MTAPVRRGPGAPAPGGDDDALRLARAAHRAAPHRPAPAFHLCTLLLERRDPEASRMLPALERFPHHAPGWEAVGRTLLPAQPAAARVALERAARAYAALEAADPAADVANRLGLVLRLLGEADGARAALERATARDPALGSAWFALGLLRQDAHDTVGAVEAFRAAAAARPLDHEPAFNLAVALQEAGEVEAALDAYATAWRLRPDSFGRIAQALVSPAAGRLWLDPASLQRELATRA